MVGCTWSRQHHCHHGNQYDLSLVGEMRVDERVHASINAVIEASQKAIEAENKVKQSRAEADQKAAEADGEARSILLKGKAQAESNRMIAASITVTMVEFQKVQNQAQAIIKWNGQLPTMMTGDVIPFLDVGKK